MSVATELRRQVPRIALRPDEAADSLGVSLGTFNKWVQEGLMPKPIHVGRICLYDLESVRNAWDALKETASGRNNSWDD